MTNLKRLKVAVTGANGFVGRNLSHLLVAKGLDTLQIVRKRKKIKSGMIIISKNLDEKHLSSKLKGCNAFVHLIGIGRQTTHSSYDEVNVNLTKKAIMLCKEVRIKKIIFISGLGVNKDTTFGYFISKFRAEQEIINSGLDYTIFRASYIIGRNDPLTRTISEQYKKGVITIYGSGKYHLQPIFIDDVVEVIFQSLTDKKFSYKIIDLVGPQIITYLSFIQNFLQGRKVSIKKISFKEAYHQALNNLDSQIGVDDLNILVGDFIGDPKILKKISHVKFKTYKKALKTSTFS